MTSLLRFPTTRALAVAQCLAAALWLGACAVQTPLPVTRDADGCHAWFAALDAAVEAAGVGDAQDERIAGFPGLRVDRVGQALRSRLEGSERERAAWLERAAALDAAARVVEIGNLPARAFPLAMAADARAALARTDECRRRTVEQLATRPSTPGPSVAAGPEGPGLLALLAERATVPDRYSTVARGAGLYALTRLPFFVGVQSWQRAHTAEVARWAVGSPPLVRYVPAPGSGVARPPAPAVHLPPDALGLPQPGPELAERLLAWHAPVFEVEERGRFDRIGAPHWPFPGAGQPTIDMAEPVVYRRLSHTQWQGRWLLQLVYTVWFPERPERSALDLLAGALDGVVVRLTLDHDGQPMLLDTIHPCGCYHMFFPSQRLRAREGAPGNEEWLYAPGLMPLPGPEGRLVVRISSADHDLNAVGVEPRGGTGRPYALRDEHLLRSLAVGAGGANEGAARRSLYGPDGLVPGTERGERFLFWPMGIASAGAMRQWGHHATAFVGRRHFDDPDLIERRFEPAAPERSRP